MLGRMGSDGMLDARLYNSLTPDILVKVFAQLLPAQKYHQLVFDVDFKGDDYTTNLKVGNGMTLGEHGHFTDVILFLFHDGWLQMSFSVKLTTYMWSVIVRVYLPTHQVVAIGKAWLRSWPLVVIGPTTASIKPWVWAAQRGGPTRCGQLLAVTGKWNHEKTHVKMLNMEMCVFPSPYI